MECYLYDGERLVFEGDGWGIIIDDGHQNRGYSEGFVYGTHQECTLSYIPDYETAQDEYSYGENCWSPTHEDGTNDDGVAICCLCETVVPEGVQALILMQVWADIGKARNEVLTHKGSI